MAATAVTLESAADLTTYARKGASAWRRRRSGNGLGQEQTCQSLTGASPTASTGGGTAKTAWNACSPLPTLVGRSASPTRRCTRS